MDDSHRADEAISNLLDIFVFKRIDDEPHAGDLHRTELRLLGDLLSQAYDRWRLKMMSADSHNNYSPYVPKIFPPENAAFFRTCLRVTSWLKGHVARSADVEFQQDYHPLTRLQLICQYARFSSLSLLMFCSHDHGMFRKQLIQGVEDLCKLCSISVNILESVMAYPHVYVPEVYGFLKYFAVALLAAAAVLTYYCPLPHDVNDAMVRKVLEHGDIVYHMIRRSLRDVDFDQFKDPTLKQIAMTDKQMTTSPLSHFLDLAAQKFDAVKACAAREGVWRHYWQAEKHGGYVPFGHELQVAIDFLKFRLRRNARLALGVYGSNEVGGLENALRDENIDYKVVHLNDFADGVLLIFQSVKHQAVDDTWSDVTPDHGIVCTDISIVFRGSQGPSIDDWKLNLLGIPFEGTIEYKGRVLLRQRMHLGFFYRAKYLVPRILNEIEHYLHLQGQKYINPIVQRLTQKLAISICGHSLGAGLSTILSYCIEAYFSPSKQVDTAIATFPAMTDAETAKMTAAIEQTLAELDVEQTKRDQISVYLQSFALSAQQHVRELDALTSPDPSDGVLPGTAALARECRRNEGLALCATSIGKLLNFLRKNTLSDLEPDERATDEALTRFVTLRDRLEQIFDQSLTKWMMPLAMLGRPVVVTTFANPGAFYGTPDLGETAMIRHVTYAVDCDIVPQAGRWMGFQHFANVENTFAFRSEFRDPDADTLVKPHLPKTYEQFVQGIASKVDAYDVVWAARNVTMASTTSPLPPDNTCHCLRPLWWLLTALVGLVAFVVALVMVPLYATFVLTRIALPHVIPALFTSGHVVVGVLTTPLRRVRATNQQAVIPTTGDVVMAETQPNPLPHITVSTVGRPTSDLSTGSPPSTANLPAIDPPTTDLPTSSEPPSIPNLAWSNPPITSIDVSPFDDAVDCAPRTARTAVGSFMTSLPVSPNEVGPLGESKLDSLLPSQQ